MIKVKPKWLTGPGLFGLLLLATACGSNGPGQQAPSGEPFLLAVVPDTQNMVDYRHQRDEGFAIDGREQFLQQLQSIAEWPEEDAEIAFVAGVGDVWQHQSIDMDEDHRARGFEAIPNPYFALELAATEQTLAFEVPTAVEGYRKLDAAGIPFGVAPGNHDYDAMWSAAEFPPRLDIPREQIRIEPEILGMLHIGGLDNFRSAFGEDSEFFSGKPWYVASFNGGASSAQRFDAGGYRFLYIALEMQPSDAVIQWAHGVIDQHPGLPTIVSTHDYLSTAGKRLPNPIVDLQRVDPDQHNSAEQLWNKLLSQRDEIFLVLCGHQHGQSRRVDTNVNGLQVHQVLADYQSRGQSALDAGQPLDPHRSRPVGVGDGWFRLMRFDLNGEYPVVRVRTWSSHYRQYSSELPQYADWYRKFEQPQMSDVQFLAEDEFELVLEDFHRRFDTP